jgi:Uma2 family endonuclease
MASAAIKQRFTPAQYLAMERKSEVKHEYYQGEIFAMAGASREHILVALNVARSLSDRLEGRPWETYISEMRVLIDETGLYCYPDVSVACGEPRFEDAEVDTLLNPTVIVEVLSPSTESYDRGKKFSHYRKIPSLREYLLISQDAVLVERFSRQDDQWVLTEWTKLDDNVQLDSIGCSVPMREIYKRVVFPREEATSKADSV